MRNKTVFLVATFLVFGIGGCSSHHEEMPSVEMAKPVAVEQTKGPIRIQVASNGYTPKSISVKPGQKITLEFHRADGNNCGEKLVFPTLGIEKDLPIGQKVLVEIPPQKSGELKFTCGMDMFRGKLVITE